MEESEKAPRERPRSGLRAALREVAKYSIGFAFGLWISAYLLGGREGSLEDLEFKIMGVERASTLVEEDSIAGVEKTMAPDPGSVLLVVDVKMVSHSKKDVTVKPRSFKLGGRGVSERPLDVWITARLQERGELRAMPLTFKIDLAPGESSMLPLVFVVPEDLSGLQLVIESPGVPPIDIEKYVHQSS